MVDALKPTAEFHAALQEMGVELEGGRGGDAERLGRYLALLLDGNTRVNLTAIVDPAQAWMRHIADSVTLLAMLSELPEGSTVIDVGSGGGVPGIPLAIVMPRLKFTLLEPTGKKAKFLEETAAVLDLKNVAVLCDRAEKVGQNPHTREKYNAVISRAVAPMNVLAELTIPLCAPGGVVLTIKGAKAEEEMAAAAGAVGKLGARLVQIVPTGTGRVVVLEKVSRTPKMYPRRDGEPKRAPLA